MTVTIQQFDFSVNLLRALLWEYSDAQNLRALIDAKDSWYAENQQGFWTNWIADVFNLETANDFGLTVWSIILGQPIVVVRAADTSKPTWGFGTYHVNFTRGNFGSTNGSTYHLKTETARILLQLRYFQLTSAGTVPEINRMLKYIFGEKYGAAWLQDNLDMTQVYNFGFPLPSDLIYIFNNFDILPRPAGVGSNYNVIVTESFGFDTFHQNFDNGNFAEG